MSSQTGLAIRPTQKQVISLPLSISAQPHLRETYGDHLARRARFAAAARSAICIPPPPPAPPPVKPAPLTQSDVERNSMLRTLERAREHVASACGEDADPERLERVLICLLVFRLGMKRATVARELCIDRGDVDQACATCSAWLARTCAAMLGPAAECADLIAKGAFPSGDTIDADVERTYSLADIRCATLAFFSLDETELVGPRRTADVARARKAYAYLARQLTNLSFPSIAQTLNRDHSTLVHSVSTTETRLRAFYGKVPTIQAYDGLASFLAAIDAAYTQVAA